jgi:serine/threonine-protein kinase
MVARLDPCNPDALRLLMSDRLPPARVSEVEDHLEFCPTCRRTLDAMVGGESWSSAVREYLSGHTAASDTDHEALDDALDFLAPSEQADSLGRVGAYEIQGVLGRGGNGIVLKAFDPGLNRYVALKVIASVLAGSGAARKRFAREAQAAAAVVHEHVVAVHAVDEANGLPYLVMEYVTGRSLQDRLDKDGPLELKEILRIATQTASGLAAAHAQGLVHRDIKPANILLENGVERVKITDFGLARAVADASLTQSGVITGTPHYMAPEQARGEAVDHRADLFALGCTMYAMAAGHPPFRADTPLAVLRRITDETPRPIREINPDVPPWFDTILRSLLAKDPDARFQSAAEVAELLERCLAHVQQPLTVGLPEFAAEDRPAARGWVAGAIVAVALGVTAAVALWPQTPTDAKRDEVTPQPAAVAAGASAEAIETLLAQLNHEADRQELLVRGVRSEDPFREHPIDAEIRRAKDKAEVLRRELAPVRK